jgi:hypothetical protein
MTNGGRRDDAAPLFSLISVQVSERGEDNKKAGLHDPAFLLGGLSSSWEGKSECTVASGKVAKIFALATEFCNGACHGCDEHGADQTGEHNHGKVHGSNSCLREL